MNQQGQQNQMHFSLNSFNKYFKEDYEKKKSAQTEIDLNIFNGLTSFEEIDRKFHCLVEKPQQGARRVGKRETQIKKDINSHQTKTQEQEPDYIHLQALQLVKLVKKSESLEQLKPDDQKLCQELGIHFNILKQLPTQEEREQYVLQQSTATIKEQLQAFVNKSETKEIQQRELEMKECIRLDRSKGFLDLFDWLKVRTQYQFLQKRLKYALVDGMNEPDCQKKILKYFEPHILTNQPSTARITPAHHRSDTQVTEGVKSLGFLSHRKLLSHTPTSTLSGSRFHATDFASKSSKKPSDFFSQISYQPREHEYLVDKNNSIPDNNYKEDKNKTQEQKQPIKKPLVIDISKTYISYFLKKKMSKTNNKKLWILQNGIKQQSRDFQQIGNKPILDGRSKLRHPPGAKPDYILQYMQPDIDYNLTQDIQKHNGGAGINNQKREELGSRLKNGIPLNAEELKFLANTSFLISRCIDKQFIQRAVNYLDNEVIYKIELNIAEQTLKTYYNAQDKLKKARFSYLLKKNKDKQKEIVNDEQTQKQKLKQQNQCEQLKRMKVNIISLLKDIERQKQVHIQFKYSSSKETKTKELLNQKNLKIKRLNGDPYSNRFVIKFKEKIMELINKKKNVLQQKKIKESFLERNVPKSIKQTFFKSGDTEYDVSKVKRFFHPPSKIIVSVPQQNNEVYISAVKKEALKTQNSKEVKKYKLGIKNQEISSNHFQQFYSGGPVNERNFASQPLLFLNQNADNHLPSKNTWISSSIEIAAANKIKTSIRAFIQKKKYLVLVEKKEFNKNKALEAQIQKYLDAKKLFEYMKVNIKKQKVESTQKQKIPSRQNERSATYQENTQQKTINIPKKEQLKPSERLAYKLSEAMIKSPQTPKLAFTIHQINNLQQEVSQTQRRSLFGQALRSSIVQAPNVRDILDPIAEVKRKIKAKTQDQKLGPISKQKEASDCKLKQRKLLIASKMKNLIVAQTAGFSYNKEDANCYDGLKNSPLYYSATNSDEEFCRYLLQLGANVNQICDEGNTPLHMAFKSGNVPIILEFLHNHGDLNIINKNGHTPVAFGTLQLLTQLNLDNNVSAVIQTKQKNHKTESDNNINYERKYSQKDSSNENMHLALDLCQLQDGIFLLDRKRQEKKLITKVEIQKT